MRQLIIFIFLTVSLAAFSQKVSGPTYGQGNARWTDDVPEGVIFYEGFEGVSLPQLPNGWTSQSVSQEAFKSGTAGTALGQTNSNGYWPVPAHGIFAMTNDDECNCNKSFDRLTSRLFDGSGLSYLKILFEAFQNGSSGQEAWLEIKKDNGPWTKIYEIRPSSRWQTHETVIPGSFLQEGFQFRFRYSDNCNYASGLALDNIYLINQPTSAFRLDEFFSIDGDVPGSGQGYELMPLRQAQYARLRFGGLVLNDSEILKNVNLKVSIQGPMNYTDSSGNWSLAPLTEDYVTFTSRNRFTPFLSGDYNISVSLRTDSSDLNDNDNHAEMHLGVGDSIYARLKDGTDGTGIRFDESGDRVGSVFQFHHGDTLKSINVNIHPASVVGSRFRIKLFSYDTLTSSLFSSSPIQITQNDLGSYKRIDINEHIGAGKILVALENETGSLIFYGNTKVVAERGNALSFQAGSPWKAFPYFVDLQLITTTISESCPGHFQYEVDDQSCPGLNDGKIKADIHDANLPWTYSWSNGAGNVDSIDNLSPGSYQLIVTDANSCIYEKLFHVGPTDSIEINPTIVADSCGTHEGRIDLNISGGTGPYAINWNGANGLNFQDDLTKGSYSIEIIDINECSFQEDISLPGTDQLGIAFTIFASGCNDSNGFAAITPFGTGPFSYSWINGEQSDTITGLKSGVYTITLSDSIGCMTVGRAFVPDSNAPSVSVQSVADIVCSDSSNGKININVSGGLPNYTYDWSNGTTDEDLVGLSTGIYDLSITDANGCKNFFSQSVSNLSSPIILDLFAKGNYCDGDSNGQIQSLVNGGAPMYSYLWSTGSDSNKLDHLGQGTYSITVTDNNGCESINEMNIASGNVILIDVDTIEYDTGGSILFENKIFVSVFGGVPPFSYLWNDSVASKDLINVDSGRHQLVVTDQLGCEKALNVDIGDGPSGKKEILFQPLKVYPNPLKSGVSMTFKSNEPIRRIQFVNVQGQTVYSIDPTETSDSIRLTSPTLSSGLYLVRISTETTTRAKRILYYQ